MPVMKNEFDIYKGSGRSRKESECSNTSCRSRKVSETRSECPSLSTSPSATDYGVQHRNCINRNNSRAFSRTSSRTSQSSLTQSPTKNCSPPKPSAGSQGSLNKFHVRLVDKLRKSFGKGRNDSDRSWEQSEDDATAAAAAPAEADNDDDLLSDHSVVKQHTTVANTTQIATKNLKKLSISSDSSVPLMSASTSPPAYDSSSNDDGLGCSDTSLHNIIISSKPPLPWMVHQRKRSRSIESSATFRSSSTPIPTVTPPTSAAQTPTKHKHLHRHSIGGRLWSRHFSASASVHDYDAEDASKTKR